MKRVRTMTINGMGALVMVLVPIQDGFNKSHARKSKIKPWLVIMTLERYEGKVIGHQTASSQQMSSIEGLAT